MDLYFEVLTTDMPFRNFTLRLYTRMLQVEDNPIRVQQLSKTQAAQLRAIFLSSVQQVKKLHEKMCENADYVDRWRPELRLFENLITEIESFVPPEECLKAEFHRLLSHPAIMLRVVPEDAFEKDARSLPAQLQFPN